MSPRVREVSQAPLFSYGAGLASVALVSGLIGLLLSLLRVANASMLYLIAVLVTAIAFGRGPAILASLVAFLTFNWFFVEPVHTFTIADPAEWIALLLFLLVAVITGQLAADQRRRTEEAQTRRREAVVLYDVVRLMADHDLDRALHAVAERLHHELRLAAVVIELEDEGRVTTRVGVGEDGAFSLLERAAGGSLQTLGQGPPPTGSRRGAPGRWVRIVSPKPPGSGPTVGAGRVYAVPIRVQSQRVGSLLLARSAGTPGFSSADDRLLSAAAAQLGLAVERARLQHEATEAEILRRTDELKSALLNAVSHDLRTPLSSIITSAGSLRQQDLTWTGKEQKELALSIEEEALRLNQIVGNLLDLSRMEDGSLRPEKGWYDLGALVDDVLGRLRPLTEKHRLVVDVPDELPPVSLDYVEIDQVLSNLVENATKYTQPGAEIKVSVRRAGSEIRVEVADRGPGIPGAASRRLFQPFYRVDARGPRPKGTGLGLAVARGLVEAHGGRIWAENRPDGGACFIFTLPAAEADETALAPREAPS